MKYFTIEELCQSATARRLGIDNTPNEDVKRCLTDLVENVLDPLRKRWGRAIIVTSGYRCTKLNTAVGGAVMSGHRFGHAADIRSVSDSRADNMRLLRCLLESGLPFDQIINEYPDAQGRPDWIHVSFRKGNNRSQLLTARRIGNKTQYSVGIKI